MESSTRQATINGERYGISIHDNSDNWKNPSGIIIYHLEREIVGDDIAAYDFMKNGEEVLREKFLFKDESIDEVLPRVLNEAVCKVERKLEEQQEFEDKVTVAIEANKEVHEGIDYQLENR